MEPGEHPDAFEGKSSFYRESYESMERRMVEKEFEHILESAPTDEQSALLQDGDLHAVLLGVKPSAWLNQRPQMAEKIVDRLLANAHIAEKFRASTATGEFEKEGLQTYRGTFYNPEMVREVVNSNRDIFEALGYDTEDPETAAQKALSAQGPGHAVEVGLLLGYPKQDVFADAAFGGDEACDESWKKLRAVLPQETVRASEDLAERRRNEENDPQNKDKPRSRGAWRQEGATGTHIVDMKGITWIEYEESPEGKITKKQIIDRFKDSGLDDLLLKWQRRHPELFPHEEPPEWLKKITEQK